MYLRKLVHKLKKAGKGGGPFNRSAYNCANISDTRKLLQNTEFYLFRLISSYFPVFGHFFQVFT